MKIDITQAKKNKGAAYSFIVSGELSNSAINYLNGKFVGNVELEGELVALDDVIEVDGILRFTISCNCDKCNASIQRDFTLDFSEDFHFNEAAFGEYAYKGNFIEPNKAMEDIISLELPLNIYCSSNCLGVCHKCGKNLNEGDCDCDKE